MLQIVIWDVQHGSAAYIKTPNEKHIAIDLGTGSSCDNNFSPLLQLKNKYNIKRLDKVIITHPHTDHIDDIENFRKLAPRTFQRPKHLTEQEIRSSNKNSDKDKVDTYLEISNSYNSPVSIENNVALPENNGSVSIKTFQPKKCNKSNINNHSIVTIVEYLNAKVIIPGDNEKESWLELLKLDSFCTAIKNTDIFVASHHGRENGFCPELFAHFTPNLVIISDGKATTTNASTAYSSKAKGWGVFSRSSGEKTTRKCLTTRTDGVININIGQNPNGRTYIKVTKD